MSGSKWNCSICTFENNISNKICEICEMGKSPDSRQEKGVVGLKNLGNTSFINSIIQCLIQTPYFVDYFLNNDYINDINKTNSLGFGGQIATIFAKLMKNIYSGNYAAFEATEFQIGINQMSQFNDDKEYDAHQMLSFLLNALHEDLNRIINKPLTESIENNENKSDDIISIRSWSNYLNRNDSIIIDQFTAQYKSTTLCPDCNYCSNTFIPYNILSVPIPNEKYKIIEYTYIDCNDASIKPTVYGQKMLKIATSEMLKEEVSKTIVSQYKKQELNDRIISYGYVRECQKKLDLKQFIPNDIIQLFCDYYVYVHPYPNKNELFVCDIWKSKIHRELRNLDLIGDINRKSDDIFIYHSKRPNIGSKDSQKSVVEDSTTDKNFIQSLIYRDDDDDNINIDKKYKIFAVINQHRIIARQQYMHGGQTRYEDEPIGYPLLITLSMTTCITIKQIHMKLWQIIKPFMRDQNLQINDENLPFQFWAAWGFNHHAKLTNDNEEIFDLNQRLLKFLIHWTASTEYISEIYDVENRLRHKSAPPPLSPSNLFVDDEDDDKRKVIHLSQCIELFCENKRLSDATWKCATCKDLKCAIKKIDLWNSPNILIIHLQRFTNDMYINEMIEYPLKGLDLSPYLLCNEEKKNNAIYDLYAITKYTDDKYGGCYTAKTKNLDNSQWYRFDDVNIETVDDIHTLITCNAYILYYHKRKTTN